MTRALSIAGVIALALVLPARGDVTSPQLSQPLIDTLTPIDTVPSSAQINAVFDDNPTMALSSLVAIANPAGSVDTGVQLRAIRALVNYCVTTPCADPDPAHVALVQVVQRYKDARSGSDLLVLRAAIESVGLLKVQNDWQPLLTYELNHPSRDIRAATARALRDLGNTFAITPLRERYNVEPDDDRGAQVRLAISDALRVLGQPL